ncbi:cytochrome P450 [Sphingomonas sp. BIUV-7]|uniref:Cytochrome P450 n=1 Tax=Sphingomonas natans TaxID=3063330 RepID=A0ABT8YA20_9SPHN|nr:cytochrome P450 [Sphingomonas sp. BIUV-7]MDO6414554.1 cytochrome P450 [Sphingomonas sp. BIUV-7]
MIENDLPAEAITDARTFTDDAALHGLLARLRRTDPLPRVESGTTIPFWLVTRHADLTAIELDASRFINAPRQAVLPLAYEAHTRREGQGYQSFMRNLVAMDGSEHRVFRAISQSRFLPKALNTIRLDIERLAAEFVDRMAGKGGSCDFAGEIAMWYPLRVIMTILGVPPQDEALMLRLTQQQLSSQDPEFAGAADDAGATTGMAAMKRMFDYFQPIIADRRINPRDDIATVIATATIDDAYLEERDVFGYFVILATAGHDTTSYSLAGGMLALLQNPDQLEKLRADPALIPSAVDEIIRWSTPVRHFCRTAVEDCQIAGKAIKKDDVLLLSYPSANRDETVFEDPFAFRIDRKPNRHLAFGTGPHLCLGQHLAKMELGSFLREFLARIDHIELVGTPRFTEATFVSGVKELPVRYRFKQPTDQAA